MKIETMLFKWTIRGLIRSFLPKSKRKGVRDMKFFIELRNGLIASLLIWGLMGYCFAEEYIISEDISEAVVKRVLDFDNMVILPTTKTVIIRTISKDLDAEGNTVRQGAGPNFIYRDVEDNPETEQDETDNSFTTFMQKLGISKATVKQAIREMENN